MEQTETTESLAELRKKQKPAFVDWINKHLPFLTDWRSLFWFGAFIILMGVLWMGYSLFTNSGTQLYGWDYTWQYINFAYRFWDIWRDFFRTGQFTFYDFATFFGADNIGSNSYYGLFDPFVFLIVLFPRQAVPQVFAFAAILKGLVGALTMRAYLRYRGISENSARVGATAFAFCGYLNFMVGFPSTVSMCCTIPLILLGIEKIIKEKKPGTLIGGLFLLGIISFFFLVVACIFGVCYAIWRYLWTIKQRNGSDNLKVIGLGVAAFGIGLLITTWTLLPSLRESTLSGRTTSIGAAYLNSLKTAFANQDFGTIMARLFEMVGDHPGREIMGLVSFFYPTCNYLYSPLYGTGYDAWTASLFCYTPMIIFFIYSLLGSIRKHEWGHLIGFAVCCYFLFTTFAYFFFYAFTGDGYGRWFIVLVPLIIYEACRGLDDLKKAPSWQLPTASLLAVAMTVGVYILVMKVLTYTTSSGVTSPVIFENWNGMTYWPSSYAVPPASTKWLIYYQMALVVVESVVIFLLKNKEYLPRVLMGFIAVETIVCGNCSFFYGSSWSFDKSLNGGTEEVAAQREVFTALSDYDSDGSYRVYSDGHNSTCINEAIGYNGSATFHSLYNYGLKDFCLNSHIIGNDGYGGTSYGQTKINSNWSGFYGNKRYALDSSAGFKYYVIRNEGYGNWDDDSFPYNVPFGSECVVKTDLYRVYKSPYANALGHGVSTLYRAGKYGDKSQTLNKSSFYSGQTLFYNSYKEIIRNEQVYLHGAIIDDDDTLDGFDFSEAPGYLSNLDYFNDLSGTVRQYVYSTVSGYGFNASDPGSFLTDSSKWSAVPSGPDTPSSTYTITSRHIDNDDQKIVWASSSSSGYFNDDKSGAYFLLGYNTTQSDRIYMIGDTFDDDGNLLKENAILNYEYHMINNWSNAGNERGSSSYSGLFGFYAPGKVKYIVMCPKGGDNGGVTTYGPSSCFLFSQDKTVFDADYNKLNGADNALTDVVYSTDKFTFKSNFDSRRVVATKIGYDKGWECVASYKGSSGSTISEVCEMHKVDGGLVGFVAPAGEVSYTMTYKTPYRNGGAILTWIGLITFFGYSTFIFIRDYKKRRRELNLDWNGKEIIDPNEIKEEDIVLISPEELAEIREGEDYASNSQTTSEKEKTAQPEEETRRITIKRSKDDPKNS